MNNVLTLETIAELRRLWAEFNVAWKALNAIPDGQDDLTERLAFLKVEERLTESLLESSPAMIDLTEKQLRAGIEGSRFNGVQSEWTPDDPIIPKGWSSTAPPRFSSPPSMDADPPHVIGGVT